MAEKAEEGKNFQNVVKDSFDTLDGFTAVGPDGKRYAGDAGFAEMAKVHASDAELDAAMLAQEKAEIAAQKAKQKSK